ncbi:MAG: succinate dehydrogenase, cytochrome b556 subunit [Alphaproteobacteria bacterium]
MTSHERPLSPHIQVYRPQLTSVLSILHRLAGMALAVGTLLLLYWLFAAAMGDASYERAQALTGSWLGRLLLFGWSLAFFFHLLNGIRHLLWDAGWGFDLKTAYASGWAVVIGTFVLTIVAWACGYAALGAL